MNQFSLDKVTLFGGQVFHVRDTPPEGYLGITGVFKLPDEQDLLESAWGLLKNCDAMLVDGSTGFNSKGVIIYRNASQIDPFRAGDHSLNGGVYGIGIREGFDPRLAAKLPPYLHNFFG